MNNNLTIKSKVLIMSGKYRGSYGKIKHIHHGYNPLLYTIIVNNSNKEIALYGFEFKKVK